MLKGKLQAGTSLTKILAVLVFAGLLVACDVQTYDDAIASIGGGGATPPPPSPPPAPPPGASFGANFSEIQAGLFSPTCASSSCHGGGSPAAGLNLEAGSSYANLVGIASSQQAGTQRVNAGSPDQSYLIQKLEGTAATGTVMPPSGGIEQADIDVVRQWISAGAIDDTAVAQDPIRVTSLNPTPNSTLMAQPAQIVAGFSRDLDESTVNTLTFTLTASGGDGNFSSGNEAQVRVADVNIRVPAANQASAVFDLTGVTLADDTYRVTLFGDGANVIMDLDANALDGDGAGTLPSGDGAAGGDFVAQFMISTPVAAGTTLDEIQAAIFTPSCAGCHSATGNTGGITNLDLSNADASFMSLVNVPSEQEANFVRVLPGQPDDSYLVQKLQGTASAGGVMPPSGMLGGAEINAVRQWIMDGALR